MRLFSALIISLICSFSAKSQTDTLAPYQKSPFIPSFKIQTPDSSWFSKENLTVDKPTLILYFSPDCGHCQLETEEIISKMRELTDLQIVMITSRSFEDMTAFAEKYKLNRFSTIRVGSDPDRLVTNFYNVKFTPFSAFYNRKGELVKVYEKGIDMKEFIDLLK